jgi:UDP-N-acetylglucosamine pyrophosphorylase
MGTKPLPYHSAFKTTNYIDKDGNKIVSKTPNAYKFEAFLFDAFGEFDDIAVYRVKREEEFAPVKNATGVDSPETARKLYNNFYKNKF